MAYISPLVNVQATLPNRLLPDHSRTGPLASSSPRPVSVTAADEQPRKTTANEHASSHIGLLTARRLCRKGSWHPNRRVSGPLSGRLSQLHLGTWAGTGRWSDHPCSYEVRDVTVRPADSTS